jgi:hypothetical protein
MTPGLKEELDMSDIPKLEPITDEILEYTELTEFQEQLLDAALAWQESTTLDETRKNWAKFKKLLVKATEIPQ